MRNTIKPGQVHWVTGASSGLGWALAIALARQGAKVAVTARRIEILETLSREAQTLPGDIIPFPGDVRDIECMHSIVGCIEQRLGFIERAILNAGRSGTESIKGFSSQRYYQCFEVNLFGVTNSLEALLPHLIRRKSGEIYFMGSLSGYRGLPGMTPYAATKAALRSTAESLAPLLAQYNIRLRIINPGFIATPMTASNPFPMPFLLQADVAARKIIHAMSRRGFEITFPRSLAWIIKVLNVLPYPLYMVLMRQMIQRGFQKN